jgi:hypothetical protein
VWSDIEHSTTSPRRLGTWNSISSHSPHRLMLNFRPISRSGLYVQKRVKKGEICLNNGTSNIGGRWADGFSGSSTQPNPRCESAARDSTWTVSGRQFCPIPHLRYATQGKFLAIHQIFSTSKACETTNSDSRTKERHASITQRAAPNMHVSR